jgi:hypothetical protein
MVIDNTKSDNKGGAWGLDVLDPGLDRLVLVLQAVQLPRLSTVTKSSELRYEEHSLT